MALSNVQIIFGTERLPSCHLHACRTIIRFPHCERLHSTWCYPRNVSSSIHKCGCVYGSVFETARHLQGGTPLVLSWSILPIDYRYNLQVKPRWIGLINQLSKLWGTTFCVYLFNQTRGVFEKNHHENPYSKIWQFYWDLAVRSLYLRLMVLPIIVVGHNPEYILYA